MAPWKHRLGELRRYFDSRRFADLRYLTVHAEMEVDEWLRSTPAAREAPLMLPPDDRCCEEKTVFLDVTNKRSVMPREIQKYKIDEKHFFLYRHLLFGNADPSVVADFWQWSTEAGRWYNSRPTSSFFPTWPEDAWGPHGYSYVWLNAVVALALHWGNDRPPGAESKRLGPSRDLFLDLMEGHPPDPRPNYIKLRTDVFTASIDTIDKVLSQAPSETAAKVALNVPLQIPTPPAAGVPGAPPTTKTELHRDETRKRPADARRDKVKTLLEALLKSGLYGVTQAEIAKRTVIDDSNLSRYLAHDSVKPTWDRYKRESVGKKPANWDDLGDGGSFSFSGSDRD